MTEDVWAGCSGHPDLLRDDMSRRVNENLVDTGHPRVDGVEIDEGIESGTTVVTDLSVEGTWMDAVVVSLDLDLDLRVLDQISRDAGGLRLYVWGFW